MILVYCEHSTPRVEYIFNVMLHVVCGYNYHITNDETAYRSYDGPSLNYSGRPLKKNEQHHVPNGLLFQNTLTTCKATIQNYKEGIRLFLNGSGLRNDIFDLFAASFYLVTRYEEYLPFVADKHNRFEASQSVLFQQGVLDRPLVNEWAGDLKRTFSKTHASLPSEKATYRYKITIDVDQAFAFKHRGFVRNAFTLLKNSVYFNTAYVSQQMKTFANKNIDPFDSFHYIKQLQEAYGFPLLYFINAGTETKYDKNVPLSNRRFKTLLTEMASYAELGLHPSYYSGNKLRKLVQEKKELEQATNQVVTRSRQHYLKLHLPTTYRDLIAIGIKEDYSMGFASQPGFRAGTCTPFPWFDLEENKATALMIYPVTYMEGTFADYLKLPAPEALDYMNKLTQIVKLHSGFHISIWHNHSVSNSFNWKGWRTVFEQSLQNIINPA